MQINNISNTNFQGSFLIKKATPEVKTTLPNLVKKGRLIFDNFAGKSNNVLMVTKDRYDNRVKDFLEGNNLKFEYFPQFNTLKCAEYIGKEYKLPELIENFRTENGKRKQINLKDKAKHVIKVNSDGMISVTNIEELNDNNFISSNIEKNVSKVNLEKNTATSYTVKDIDIKTTPLKNSSELIQNIAKKHKIDPNAIVKSVRGANVIDLRKKGLTILISKPDEKGLHYVKVMTKGQESNRMVTDKNGKTLYYMNELSEVFDRKFNALLDPKS